MSVVIVTVIGDVAVIEIDNPPVNALSQAVRTALLDAVRMAEADARVAAMVIAAAGRTFPAGGDIMEFGKAPAEPHLPDVAARIEACAKPIVAAWHGTALGGGCEIGLAAHCRIMSADATVGLPEVRLGLVPGSGGTQRLSRLVGQTAALDMAATGRMVHADEALALGLIDVIVTGDVRECAVSMAKDLIGRLPRRTGHLPRPPGGQESDAAATAALRKTKGRIAPAEAVRLVRLSGSVDLEEGLAEERRTFFALMAGEESRALRHLFFAEREARKHDDLKGIAPMTVDRVGIIGAGLMGAGIAVACLDAGFSATLVETTDAALARGRERIDGLYGRSVKNGRISEKEARTRINSLQFTTEIDALARVDLAIEAVFEDLSVKQALLKSLEDVMRPDAVIATNTSYLDIEKMAEGMRGPQRFLGLHFFSPANVMRLLEVVRASATSSSTLATGLMFGRSMQKLAVVSGVCDGFIGNRILARTRSVCEGMLADGETPYAIDAAMEAYGFAMGPFAVQDLAGLDIAAARRRNLCGEGKSYAPSPLGDALVEMGRLGRKAGAGWYRYENDERQTDPEVEALVQKHAAARHTLQSQEIVTRVLDAMASEGRTIVEEGVAARASDIDLVLVNGYGFPAHKGGPMFQASERVAR